VVGSRAVVVPVTVGKANTAGGPTPLHPLVVG